MEDDEEEARRAIDDDDDDDGRGREGRTRAVDVRLGERRTKASRHDRWTRDSTRRDRDRWG